MLYLVIVAGIVLDQLSKWLIVENLPLHSGFEVIPWLLNIYYVQNTGGAWSLMNEHTGALAAFSVVIMAGVIFALYKTPKEKLLLRYAFALIISGAIGNLIDRVRLGYVVDFIKMPNWPVFNIADILLCVGVAMLFLEVILEEINERKRNA